MGFGQFEWYRGIFRLKQLLLEAFLFLQIATVKTAPHAQTTCIRKDENKMKKTKKMVKRIALSLMTLLLVITSVSSAVAEKTQYTITIAQFAEHGSLDNCREGFMKGLAEEGFIEGENLTIHFQNAQADMGMANQIAGAQAAEKPDLMMAIATPMAQAAYIAGSNNKVPVIYTAVTDPVMAGLADENQKAPGEITGTSDKLPIKAQLEMIRAMMPQAKTIGILYTLSEANSESAIAEYQALAPDYGFDIVAQGIGAGNEIALALDTVLSKVDCMTNLTDNTVVSYLSLVLDRAKAKNVPVFGSEIEQVKLGCVASEGLEYVSLGAQTGRMAARVLKGELASNIPYEIIEESQLYINTQALNSFGITLPETLLARAQEVGE